MDSSAKKKDNTASFLVAIAVSNLNWKGDTQMKTSRITIGIVTILSFVLFGLPGYGDGKVKKDPETTYSSAIDKEIAKCQHKMAFINSGSVNLQREAALANMKATFLKDYKQGLIADMKKANIGAKDYQVTHYLNERFFEVFGPILQARKNHTLPAIVQE
jgi:hypothetical protein